MSFTTIHSMEEKNVIREIKTARVLVWNNLKKLKKDMDRLDALESKLIELKRPMIP